MPLMTPPPVDQQQEDDEILLVPHSLPMEDDEMLVPHSLSHDLQAEAPNAVDGPTSGKFTWTIEKFSRLNTKKLYSDVFVVGGFKWRILTFPKGNNVECLSTYLDVADSSTLSDGWTRYAQFSLTVVNQIHQKYSIRKETRHQLNIGEIDWGFTSLIPLEVFCDPSKGFLVNDTCIIEAHVDTVRSPEAETL